MYIWIIHGEFIQVEEAWKYDKKSGKNIWLS